MLKSSFETRYPDILLFIAVADPGFPIGGRAPAGESVDL